MLYQDILNSAIRMLGECNGNTSDYEERAAYLLSTFCSDRLSLDMKYRTVQGETPTRPSIPVKVTLTDEFPLCEAFAPAATYYLASMLVLEENEDISERLFEHYSDSISAIRAELFAIRNTKNRYPLA